MTGRGGCPSLEAHRLFRDLVWKSDEADRLEAELLDLFRDAYEGSFGRRARREVDEALAEFGTLNELFAGGGPLPNGDVGRVVDRVQGVAAGVEVPTRARRRLQSIVGRAYRLERARTAKLLEVPVEWSSVDRDAVEWITENGVYWIGRHYDETLSARIVAAAADAGLVEGLGVADVAERMSVALADVASRSDSYWRGMAATVVTRARNFGAVETLRVLEVTEVEILAVMDGRTSPVCRHLNGKVYRVTDLVAQRDRMMGAATPEEVRAIAPWLPFKEVRELAEPGWKDARDVDRLVAAGVALPPYHFHCRTGFVVRVFRE